MAKTSKLKSILVLTLGCSKNVVDSENLLGKIKNNNYRIVLEPEKADIIIINTCGFIQDSKEESMNVIHSAIDIKLSRQYKLSKIFVMGCLSQRYAEQMKLKLPELDGIFGVDELDKIILTLDESNEISEVDRYKVTPRHYSYLKISEGCDNRCSYCAIPVIRGNFRSVPLEKIIEEAERLASQGTKELLIIAQDTTNYGIDLYGKRRIVELVDKISDIKSLEWVRVLYAHPKNFPLELLDLISSKDNICNYLDLPIQHISDKILTAMNRHVTSQQIKDLIHLIQLKYEKIALRTTLMVGFPKETENDFKELLGFIKDAKFNRLGVFKYSKEENTPAFKLNDNLSDSIKERRVKQLIEAQYNIAQNLNSTKIGTIQKVIVESKEKGNYIARTEFDAPDVDNIVYLSGYKNLKKGEFYNVKITGAEAYSLIAEKSK